MKCGHEEGSDLGAWREVMGGEARSMALEERKEYRVHGQDGSAVSRSESESKEDGERDMVRIRYSEHGKQEYKLWLVRKVSCRV